MVMDKSIRGLYGSVNGLKLHDDAFSAAPPDENLANGLKWDDPFLGQDHVGAPPLPLDPGSHHEDFDFSDVVLKYISEMLMEEDMEEKACMFQESSAALQAAERSLYELIGEKYPSSPKYSPMSHPDHDLESPGDSSAVNHANDAASVSYSSVTNIVDSGECKLSKYAPHSPPQSLYSSGSSTVTALDGHADSPISSLGIPDIFSEDESVLQFKKGFEEASKFLPKGSLFLKDVFDDTHTTVKVEQERQYGYHQEISRGTKNPHIEDFNCEEDRSNKQSAVSAESTLSAADFDMVLLNCGTSESALRVALQHERSKNVPQDGSLKGSNGGKARGKKQGKKKVVDLRTLLTMCAQAVATDDRRNANELLKHIRQNASPTGDGMQRLAHIFADGLEARLAGSGTQIYKTFIARPTSAATILKAYQLFLAACPFRKLSNFFSNKTIMNLAEKATTLHIVDFGIMYGFQWPCLIHRLSTRPGGPPKLRITGVDLPNPGFRPAERVEETGRRLENYAERFNVPFEFNAIAKKWDTIQMDELKIDRNEVLVVNCLYRLRSLLDETVVIENPRDIVLNLIRKMNPDVFILGIVNGSYGAPFFITRFREALFHYSTLFDMLETNVPREIPERMLIEKDIFGWEAMNVIACEGAERIERPETYKQWQARILRAGFRQLPLNDEITSTAKERVDALYHKDFVIDEDSCWLLQGWKGRIVYSLSSWKPNQ